MTISFTYKGDFDKTTKFLRKSIDPQIRRILNKYGRAGVHQLSQATPYASGKTSRSWEYAIDKTAQGYTVRWYNTNIVGGVPVVILLQYGHGTGTGGYVNGRDFINPETKVIFKKMAEELWKEVKL